LVLCEEDTTDPSNDKTLNFSDVTDIIPNAQAAHVLWVFTDYTATATPGARFLEARITDSNDDTIFSIGSDETANITAGVNALIMWGQGLEAVNVGAATPSADRWPEGVMLTTGQKLRVFERTSTPIDTDDDLIIHVMLAVYT
jgi:hypothetical protein